MRHHVSSPDAPAPVGTYSAAIAHGGLLFISGQGPFDVDGKRVGDTFADQVRQTFRNLQAQAEAGGTDLRHAVRYGVYLRDLDDFQEFNEVAKEFLEEPYPARTTVPADLRGFDVEIDAIVAVPSS